MKVKISDILVLLLLVFTLGTLVFGAVLAFKASVVLFVASLFLSPAFWVYGICGLFGTNLPQLIVEWFSKHS